MSARPRRNQDEVPALVATEQADVQTERAVLGGALFDRESIPPMRALTREHFHNEHNRVVFQHLARLDAERRPLDLLTLERSLRDSGDYEAAGGGPMLGWLAEAGALTIPAYMPDYCATLDRLYRKRTGRALALTLADHLGNGHDPDDPGATLLPEANALVELVTPRTLTSLEPELERIGDDFVATIPARGVRLEFEATRAGADGIRADLRVMLRGAELDWGALPLSSTTARVSRASKLTKRAPGLPWEQMLDRACSRVASAVRAGEPATLLVPRPRERAAFLIEPFLPYGQPTVLHSDGGNGKSLLSIALAKAVHRGETLPGFGAARSGVKTLLLDYETDEDTVAHRAHLQGLEREAIVYRRMVVPLIEDAAAVRRDAKQHGVGLVIVDSLQYAVAGGEGRGDVSTPYLQAFNVLRSLGPDVSALILAHHSHAGDEKREAHPYGSRFIHNACRARWELRSEREDATDLRPSSLLMALYHRKANDDWLRAPLALRAVFERLDGGDVSAVRFQAGALRESVALLSHAPVRERIKAALSRGTLDVEALVERLAAEGEAVPAKTVRGTLDRYAGKDWLRLPSTSPVQWGLAEHVRR